MKRISYTAEFKVETINQITEHGYNTAGVAEHLAISTKSIYS